MLPTQYKVNLFRPYVPEDAITNVVDVLRSKFIGQGPKVDTFEREYAVQFKHMYPVALSSGSAALETAYELVGIQPGDEVISTPLTSPATNIPLLRMGAKIVWADINRETLCLNREDVLNKITKKTKAIVNVHLGGVESKLAKMPVPIISDASQALGIFNGDYTCNSFQAIKHVTTGDGGMLVVKSHEDYERAKLMRWFGIDREKRRSKTYLEREMTRDIEILGYKRQMNDIAAAMGIAGLKHYDEVIAYREKIFNLYKKLLKVPVVDGERNVYWLCTVLVENRDFVASVLLKNGVETNLVHIRNDAYKIFGGLDKLPVMDEIESKYLCLPLHMGVTEADVVLISNLVNTHGTI